MTIDVDRDAAYRLGECGRASGDRPLVLRHVSPCRLGLNSEETTTRLEAHPRRTSGEAALAVNVKARGPGNLLMRDQENSGAS